MGDQPNDSKPATKDDLKKEIGGLRSELKQDLAYVQTELKQDLADVRTELKVDIDRLETRIGDMKSEIIKHFNVVAENIRKDVATANQDEISLIDDRVKRNSGRLDRVEKQLGISH